MGSLHIKCIIMSCSKMGGSNENVTKRDEGGWVELNVTSRLNYICGMKSSDVVARQINFLSVVHKKRIPRYLFLLK